ncbi:hypothetical protein BU23DRAFT_390486, partial [Bimuria novae-zelandiae CBS 107.79]
LRMHIRQLLFSEFSDPALAQDAAKALRTGLTRTMQQFPFLAGSLRLADAKMDRVSLQYPDSISDGVIDQIFTVSYDQVENPDLEFAKMETAGFLPLPIWGDVFCPKLLRSYPGLEDEFAVRLVSFNKGVPVPVLAAQATFVRGGLVLSVYAHHSAIDGTGLAIV